MSSLTTSSSTPSSTPSKPTLIRPLLSGALAGLSVDVLLYPLDTLKTRLQSSSGFVSSGGFRGVYAGLGSVVVGSAPGGALFFVFYEGVKSALEGRRREGRAVFGEAGAGFEHMLAASIGEVAACAVRVPTEVVKQRAQAVQAASSRAALRQILDLRGSRGVMGVWRELYRGWAITVFREVPFTAIQFPLWETLKGWGVRRRIAGRDGLNGGQGVMLAGKKEEATAVESAAFGCVSGATAAAATTPLDVLKTRMMLAREKTPLVRMAGDILTKEGPAVFFRGIGPRVAWISIGGAVFLGSYQWACNMLGAVV